MVDAPLGDAVGDLRGRRTFTCLNTAEEEGIAKNEEGGEERLTKRKGRENREEKTRTYDPDDGEK